jgi:putative membrane protein
VSSSPSAPESARARLWIGLLSAAVFVAVALAVRGGPAPELSADLPSSAGPSLLARINVVLNASSGIFLLLGYAFIRRRQIPQHRFCMLSAFGLSSAFLVSYLLHHARVGSVPFRGAGGWRQVYYAILLPHVLLAGVIVPLALFTVYRAWTGQLVAHRRIARITLPLWLFVSISGVIVFVLLYYSPS